MDYQSHKIYENALLNLILDSDSHKWAVKSLGLSEEAAREKALGTVRLDYLLSNWNFFTETVEKVNPQSLKGPVLDLGCGKGNLVYHGLKSGFDMHGVDISQDGIDFYRERIRLYEEPAEWQYRCQVADGQEMPYESNFFSAVHSNYVLEHIQNLGEVLRETARVTRPGGVIYIKAQDARISFEGHYGIPWLPFMPRQVARIWLEEFGKPDGYLGSFHYITTPQVASILETCGCHVAGQSKPPREIISNHWQIRSETDIRGVARQVKEVFDRGDWPKQPGSLFVVAVKK